MPRARLVLGGSDAYVLGWCHHDVILLRFKARYALVSKAQSYIFSHLVINIFLHIFIMKSDYPEECLIILTGQVYTMKELRMHV